MMKAVKLLEASWLVIIHSFMFFLLSFLTKLVFAFILLKA